MEGCGWGVGVGKCVTKENPKSNLDLDLEFVNNTNKSLKEDSPYNSDASYTVLDKQKC